MRVLIPGGAGFIGSHLVEELRRLNHDVWTIDPKPLPGHQAIQGWVQNEDISNESWDVIYHCGAVVGVQDVITNPQQCVKNEMLSTLAVTKLAEQTGARLLYLSTSDCYGHHGPGESRETDNLCIGPTDSPRWSYAAAKLAGEHLVRWSECESVVVRLFNIAGPRQRAEAGVIAKWCKLAVEGKPLPLYGDGKQTRTFLHVLDLVDALVLLGTCSKEKLPAICNVGSPRQEKLLDLVDYVCGFAQGYTKKEFHHNARVEWESFDGDEPRDKMPNLDRIGALGWAPKRQMHEIIKDTLDYWWEDRNARLTG